MKKNRLLKYGFMTILTYIGLFVVDASVDAKEITCNYSFDFKYERINPSKELSDTADFQLIFKSDSIDGYPGYSSYELKVTGDYSIEARPKRSDGTILFDNDSSMCPDIYLYQRRTGTITKYNIAKFYLFSKNGITTGKSDTDFLNACAGKSSDEEVLDGYKCGNIIGPINGTKAITTCDDDEIKEIVKAKKELFKTNVESVFNNEYNRLNSSASSFTKTTTKEMCDNYKASWNSEILKQPLSNFSNESQELLNNLECKMDDATKEELSNYDTSGRKTITFYDKAKAYTNSLLATFEANVDKCYKNATDMTEEDKEDAQEDVDDLREESEKQMNEYTDTIIDDYLKYVDKITSINLGSNAQLDCQGLLGDDLLDLLAEIFSYVQIAAPILLIVLGSVDFAQAVFSDDKDALKKATSRFVKRAIVCVVIFFVPLILNYLLNFVDDIGKDPLCGIR